MTSPLAELNSKGTLVHKIYQLKEQNMNFTIKFCSYHHACSIQKIYRGVTIVNKIIPKDSDKILFKKEEVSMNHITLRLY